MGEAIHVLYPTNGGERGWEGQFKMPRGGDSAALSNSTTREGTAAWRLKMGTPPPSAFRITLEGTRSAGASTRCDYIFSSR